MPRPGTRPPPDVEPMPSSPRSMTVRARLRSGVGTRLDRRGLATHQRLGCPTTGSLGPERAGSHRTPRTSHALQSSRRHQRPSRRPGCSARSSAHASTTERHQSSGSCSARSGEGWVVAIGARVSATSRWSAQRAALVALVPKSSVRTFTCRRAPRRSSPTPRSPHARTQPRSPRSGSVGRVPKSAGGSAAGRHTRWPGRGP